MTITPSNMAYTKLFNSIITSTIWSEDDKTRIVWITMLAIADKNGEVQGSIPGLARIAGVGVEDCRSAIGKFLSPDLDSRTKDDEGRRIEEIDGGWSLLNHAKYRRMASDVERAEQAAIRQQRKRARDKGNDAMSRDSHAPVTQESRQNSQAEEDADTKAHSKESPKNKEESKTPCGEVEEVFEKWNLIDGPQKIIRISTGRRSMAKTRLTDPFFRDNWRAGLESISANPFMHGVNARGWKADIDWFLKPDSLIRIIEGKYTQKPQPARDQTSRPKFAGMQEDLEIPDA